MCVPKLTSTAGLARFFQSLYNLLIHFDYTFCVIGACACSRMVESGLGPVLRARVALGRLIANVGLEQS